MGFLSRDATSLLGSRLILLFPWVRFPRWDRWRR